LSVGDGGDLSQRHHHAAEASKQSWCRAGQNAVVFLLGDAIICITSNGAVFYIVIVGHWFKRCRFM